MRTATLLPSALVIALAGCSTVTEHGTDTGIDVPAETADTSGEVDVTPDLPDVVDVAPEPDAVDEPLDDPVVEPVEDPVEEPVPDVTDALEVLDPPWEPRPDLPPDTTVDPRPDPTLDPRPDTTWDVSTDPAGDCAAGTCTDYVGRTVCIGGTGLTTCPTDPSCVALCVCTAPSTWGICLHPCIC
jgi:hypothetical protein